MMKKLLAFLLVAILALSVLTACNDDSATERKSKNTKDNTESQDSACKHTGGTATCATLAVCDKCKASYGELNPENHEKPDELKVISLGKEAHAKGYTCCNTPVEEPVAHTWKDGKCTTCNHECVHEIDEASGICKYCQPTSQGLAYVLVGPTDSYKVNGIGSCTDTTIIIPSTFQGKPVTSIASRAFEEQKKITNVVIPSTITTIGDNAFYGCIKLKSVTIPESVTKIGNSAFERCSLLKSVTFENTEGWAVSENGKPEGATDISAADLADVAKAAELLRLSSTGYTKMAWFIKES